MRRNFHLVGGPLDGHVDCDKHTLLHWIDYVLPVELQTRPFETARYVGMKFTDAFGDRVYTIWIHAHESLDPESPKIAEVVERIKKAHIDNRVGHWIKDCKKNGGKYKKWRKRLKRFDRLVKKRGIEYERKHRDIHAPIRNKLQHLYRRLI